MQDEEMLWKSLTYTSVVLLLDLHINKINNSTNQKLLIIVLETHSLFNLEIKYATT